jgi:hypothetical protein
MTSTRKKDSGSGPNGMGHITGCLASMVFAGYQTGHPKKNWVQHGQFGTYGLLLLCIHTVRLYRSFLEK